MYKELVTHRFICIRARLTQFKIPFIYFKTGGSPRKFYGGDGFSSMFLRKMDFNTSYTPFCHEFNDRFYGVYQEFDRKKF